jgi:hypothetical protein
MTPRPDPPPTRGIFRRARGHLMDVTPLKVSRDGGLITIVGIGLLGWFAPGFWRYDARHPRALRL